MSDELTLSLPERRLITLIRRTRVRPLLVELALRSMPEVLQQIGDLHGYALGAEQHRQNAIECEFEEDVRLWGDRIDEIARLSEQMGDLLGRIAAQLDPTREVER